LFASSFAFVSISSTFFSLHAATSSSRIYTRQLLDKEAFEKPIRYFFVAGAVEGDADGEASALDSDGATEALGVAAADGLAAGSAGLAHAERIAAANRITKNMHVNFLSFINRPP
jgi:hypothetical protein